MTDFRYDPECDTYVEVDQEQSLRMEAAWECAAQEWRISETQRRVASGDYVTHDLNLFTKQDVDALKEAGLRFATDDDRNAQDMYMQNIDGHLRVVKVCPLETGKKAAHDFRAKAESPAQASPASAGTPTGQAQNPARATSARQPPAIGLALRQA